MKKIAILLAMTLMAAPTLSQAATAAANTINSAAIIQADGTSGQTLTTGNGVKTGHIQNSAITAAKLAAGSVSSSKIFGQLSTSKLRVGTIAGTVAAGNHTHVINTADLAAGAVTDAKISGVISTSKLSVGTAAGTVAAGNHTHDTIYAKKYAGVVVVAKTGGDFTSPVDAMNSVTTATAASPVLVKVMPGTYDLGSGTVQMKPFVTLEGSGDDATIIVSKIQNVDWDTCAVGTITMSNDSTVRNLYVINTAPDVTDTYLFAGIAFNNVKGTVEGVKVYVGSDTGLSGRNAGICYAGPSADAFINNVSSEAHGFGNTSGIINRDYGSATVLNSRMLAVVHGEGTARAVNCAGDYASITVVNSLIEGRVTADATSSYMEAADLWGCNASISNSTIRGANPAGGHSVGIGDGTYTTSIVNSQIYAVPGMVGIDSTSPVTKISNTLIQKGVNTLDPATKLFNCYDENFNGIPNQ